MPLFIVERNFAEQVEFNRDIVTESIRVNTDVDIKWLSSCPRFADAWLADQHGESALRRRDVREHRLQLP